MNMMREFFKNTSKILTDEYERSRPIGHNVSKGSAREFFIRKFIEKTFPRKYVIDKGIILGADGTPSDEADIVVYNESMPLLDYGGTKHFLSDGVFAHIEVKSYLTSKELTKALRVAESVKRLDKGRKHKGYVLGGAAHRIFSAGMLPAWIFSCVFAYEGLLPETFIKTFRKYYEGKSDPLDACVDAVCVLDRGYTFRRSKQAEKELKLGRLVDTGEDSLMCFFLLLFAAMYQKWQIVFDMTDYLGELKYTLKHKYIYV